MSRTRAPARSSATSSVERPRVAASAGADLYASSGTALAVDGSTLVLGPNSSSVVNALDRHADSRGISKDEYSRSTTGLPTDAMLYAFGNLQRILAASPRARRDARIPWVGAVTRYGVSVAPSSSGLTIREHVDTSGATLTSAQLPFAPGKRNAFDRDLPVQGVGIEEPQRANH